MKTLLRTLFLGGLLSALVGALPVAAFEGRITLNMKSGKDTHTINYAIGPDAIRMEMGVGENSMAGIVNLKKQEMIMLMPEERMYMVMPFKQAAKQLEETELKQHNLERTGRTEKILGYDCEEYVSRERNTTTESWVTKGLGTFIGLSGGEGGGGGFMGMGGRGRAAGNKWESAFKGQPAFPLRVVSRDAKGKETSRMETTKIEPGPLPASLFQPPAGWERFQMPDLGGLNPFKKG